MQRKSESPQVLPGDIQPTTPPSNNLSPAPVSAAQAIPAPQYVIVERLAHSLKPPCPNWLKYTFLILIVFWNIMQILILNDFRFIASRINQDSPRAAVGAVFVARLLFSEYPTFQALWLTIYLSLVVIGVVSLSRFYISNGWTLLGVIGFYGLVEITYILSIFFAQIPPRNNDPNLRHFVIYIISLTFVLLFFLYSIWFRPKKSAHNIYIQIGSTIYGFCIIFSVLLSIVTIEFVVGIVMISVGLAIFCGIIIYSQLPMGVKAEYIPEEQEALIRSA